MKPWTKWLARVGVDAVKRWWQARAESRARTRHIDRGIAMATGRWQFGQPHDLNALLEADAALVREWSHRIPTFYQDWELVRRAHANIRPDLRIDRFVLLCEVADAVIAHEGTTPRGDRWRMFVALCDHQVKLPVVPDEEEAA